MIWTKDSDYTLLYMRDYLNLSYSSCAEILSREYKESCTKGSVIGRHRRLKVNGLNYVLQPGEDVLDESH